MTTSTNGMPRPRSSLVSHLPWLTASVLIAACDSKTEPASMPTPYELVWADEFDMDGDLNPAHWNHTTGGSGFGNNELQFYTGPEDDNAWVEDGHLVIEARLEDREDKHYTSARVNTRGKHDITYGRVEVRARLPEGRGTWPAIWMLYTDDEYGNGGWPDNGEIDIMEHVGFDQGTVHSTVHTADFNHVMGTQVGASIYLDDVSTAFHVYAIEWTPEKIRASVDDSTYFTFENTGDGWGAWPFDHDHHLILNIAVGGNWGGQQGVDDTIFPQRLEIDYVRIFGVRS